MLQGLKRQFAIGRPNLDQDRWLRLLVAWFPVVFILVVLCIKIYARSMYGWLYREDGLIEWGTAVAFIAAALFAFLLALRLRQDRKNILAILYLGLAAGMMLAMLEEISWGQRVVGLETPEFFAEHSTKNEINIHNLKQFPLGLAFIVVGFYGSFSRLLLPGRVRRRFPLEVSLLTPRFAIAGYFLPTFLLYTYYEYIYYTVIRPLGITIRRDYSWQDHFIIGKDQEAIELLLAIGFTLFVLDNWQRHRALRAGQPRAAGER